MLHKQCDWIPTHLVPLYSRTGLVSILNDTGSLFAPCQRTFDTISNAYIGIWRVSIKAKAKVDELSSGREKKIDHRTNFRFPTGYFQSECFAIETLWFITACVVFEADLCVPIFILYQKNSEQSLTLKELSETKSKKVIEKRISDNNCNNTLYIPFSFLIVRVSWKLFIKAEKTKKSKHFSIVIESNCLIEKHAKHVALNWKKIMSANFACTSKRLWFSGLRGQNDICFTFRIMIAFAHNINSHEATTWITAAAPQLTVCAGHFFFYPSLSYTRIYNSVIISIV